MDRPTVVDSHQHFWDPARADYPWMTDEVAAIRRPFTPGDLRPALETAGVDYTVLVQTRSSEDETRAFMATAAATPFVAGVVGWVDLTAPDVADRIAALQARPDGATLVGIRHQAHDEPDPRWLLREDVRRGLRAVRDAGLAYDLLVRTRELPAALETARAFPDLHFVIDHIAKPPIKDGETEGWAAALSPFREHERVCCKLSGMVTEADWGAWTPADLQPYIDRVGDIFGEDRLMFGSDWPVCLLAAPYATVYDTLREALRALSSPDQDKIFGANAMRFYRLHHKNAPFDLTAQEQAGGHVEVGRQGQILVDRFDARDTRVMRVGPVAITPATRDPSRSGVDVGDGYEARDPNRATFSAWRRSRTPAPTTPTPNPQPPTSCVNACLSSRADPACFGPRLDIGA